MPAHLPRARKTLILSAAVLAAIGITIVHVYVERQGNGYVGALLALDHLFDLAAALGLLAVCVGVGRFALARAGVTFRQPLDALLFAVPVGCGIVAAAILVVGFVGLLRPAVLLLLIAAAAVVARHELGELPSLLRGAASYARGGTTGAELGLLGALVLGAATVFLMVFALAPPVDWDSLLYHLQVPAQFLEHGRIYLPEDNLKASYINLVHMLYLPLLAVGSQSGPAVVSAVMAVLLGVAVFSFCARFLPGVTGSVSLILLFGTTTVVMIAITPRVDVTLAFFLFLAHSALLMALTSADDRRFFYLAAVVLGLSIAVKYHALPYIIALSPLILWTAVAPTRRISEAVRPLLIFGLLVAAGAVPWLLKNWVLLGAPIYPVLATPLLSPWLGPFFGSATVPTTVDSDILQIVWASRAPFNFHDAFADPGRISIEWEGRFYFANPAFVALPLWLFFLRNRILNWLLLPAIVYLVVLLVPFPQTNPRYLAAAVAPLTIVVAHLLVRVSERWLSRLNAHYVLGFLTLLCLLPSIRTARTWIRETQAVGHVVGKRSTEEFMATHILPGVHDYAPLIEFVNERVPAEGRILMLFEDRGFYFEPGVVQDHNATTWSLLAPIIEPGDCLQATGNTHVLLGVGAARYYVRGGVDQDLLRTEEFQRFAERCLVPIYDEPGYVLFRVDPARASEMPEQKAWMDFTRRVPSPLRDNRTSTEAVRSRG